MTRDREKAGPAQGGDRQKRLAEALRANLRRRKAAERADDGADGAAPARRERPLGPRPADDASGREE